MSTAWADDPKLLPPVTSTIPMRKPEARWHVGDLVEIGRDRWIIRAISPRRGVQLEHANATNAAVRWTTTLDRLPRKTS